MITFTIIIILTIIATIVLFFKKTQVFDFNTVSTLVQTVLVFIALWFTVYTIQSSSSDTQTLFKNLSKFSLQFSKMDSTLNNVSDKLKMLPAQIQNFSRSLDTLNSISSVQSKDFKSNTIKLNRTISGLSNSVNDFETNIDNYSDHIKTIVDLTDIQLKIWKEQQRVLLDEFSRQPVLRLVADEAFHENGKLVLGKLRLINDGNIEASVLAIYFIFPEGKFNIYQGVFNKYKTENGKDYYNFDFFDIQDNGLIVAGSSVLLDTWEYKIIDNNIKRIEYGIDFVSKYGSGQQMGFIDLK